MDTIRKRKIYKIGYHSLYYLFIFIIILFKSLDFAGDDNVYNVLFFLSLILLFSKVIRDKWKKEEIIILLFLLFIILINYYIVRRQTLLFGFLIVIGLKELSLHKILKMMLYTRIFGYILTIVLASLGIIENKVILFWRNDGFVSRSALGFSHPNSIQNSLFFIVILIVYFYYEKLKNIYILPLFLINYIVYTYSLSRTGFYSINLLLILCLLTKNRVLSKIILKLNMYIQFILLTFTIVICFFFNNTEFFYRLNRLLTGRLSYSRQQLLTTPNLFGYHFNSKMLFDNSYSMILSLYGIIIATIMLFYYYKVSKTIYYKNNIVLGIIFFALSVNMFSEGYILNPVLNITILFMAKYFYREYQAFERKGNVIYSYD